MKFALRLALVLVPAIFAAGCPGCTIPFSVNSNGKVTLALGGVDPTCTGGSPDGGDTRPDGSVVTYTHEHVGTDCVLSATWTGTLLDMAAIRADTEKQLKDGGLDPATVQVNITTLTPVVDGVTLIDDDTGNAITVPAPGLENYHGGISVDTDTDIIVVDFDSTAAGADPTKPVTTVRDSPRLVELANTAYAGNGPLPASGAGNVKVGFDAITPVVNAGTPALVISFALTVEGTAAPGL